MSFLNYVRRGTAAALLVAGLQAATNNNASVGDLAAAVRAGDDAAVKRLLEKQGADPNAKDASERGDARVIDALLKAGADVQARNDRRETAMTFAMWNGENPIVDALRKAGAPTENYPASIPSTRVAAVANIQAAVEKGLSALQHSSPEFVKKSGCVSCHHQGLPGTVIGMAKQRGWEFDQSAADRDIKTTIGFLKPAQEVLLEGSDVVPQVPQTGGYLLMSLAAQAYPSDDLTTAVVHNIAMRQRLDGAWTGWSPRPPITGGDIRETAVAIRGMLLYAPAGRRAEFEQRAKKAAEWLAHAKSDTPEEEISRLLGLVWAKADVADIRKAANNVLAAQRTDGGWTQLSSRDSDAYATGEALYALKQSGALNSDSAEYRRGIEYLLRMQQADGSWHVKTRAFPFQPLVESGFPHGRDQWISASGTSWALAALMAGV